MARNAKCAAIKAGLIDPVWNADRFRFKATRELVTEEDPPRGSQPWVNLVGVDPATAWV